MKKVTLKRQLQNDNGLSLIEVIVSIVILTIILLSVYKLLISSATTSKSSETIIDTTYIAQTEIEKFYSFAKENTMPAQFDKEIFPSYRFIRQENTNTYVYKNDSAYNDFSLELKLKLTENNGTRVILRVYDNNNVLKSQMETTIEWRE